MAGYGHGGNAKEIARQRNMNYENIIDFSANINPLGISKRAKNSICENLHLIEKYPDITYYELKKSIAHYENLNSEYIALGNGAAELLFNIIRALNPKKTLLLAPTFSEYEEAVKSINGKVKYYYLYEKNLFNIREDYLSYINQDIELLIICNPNNPTGNIVSREYMIKIIKKAEKYNVKIIIDESFMDFLNNECSLKDYIPQYPFLIIVKSLTKFFAMPGLRIGYALCSDNEIINRVNLITPAWNINILAEKAAISALKDREYIKKTRNFINKEKQYLYEEMLKIKDITVFKPNANYLFFKINKNLDLFTKLLEKNILIRKCENYNGLNGLYYRIGIRDHESNIILINVLKKILV